jgi:ectoine hydroxylase-related dioxygenase (phytanoyl-CoA dioxygenase family)
MLTLRIHLDQVTESNGPLEVAVGSHANGKRPDENHKVEKILVNSGAVLAMRPMLSHASGSSDPNTDQHRRILHLEFAADRNLPDGYQWHQYL